jgi:hypothetical protein
MRTIPVTLRDIMSLGLGGASWQQFVDKYEEKYDEVSIDGFDFDPITIGYTFAQLVSKTAATVLPTYVDPESEGFEMPLGTAEGITGNIPTQKLYYSVNRVVVREQMQLAQRFGALALNDDMRDIMFKLLDEGTDGLIQSFYNALNHQRHQVVSTGQFQITATNNPRGIKGVTIGFGIPAANIDALTTNTARWWTNASHTTSNQGSASDPIKYMQDRVKYIRRTGHYYGPLRLELCQDLWDDLLTHTAVLQKIGYNIVPTAASAAVAQAVGENTPDEQKKEIIRKLIKVDEIVTRDTYAYVSAPDTTGSNAPDLVTTQVENFKKENISFIPTGKIGGIQGVQPLSMGYDANDIAYAMGNRLLIEQEGIPRTHSINVNGEMAQLCVPSAVRQMFISTVTV